MMGLDATSLKPGVVLLPDRAHCQTTAHFALNMTGGSPLKKIVSFSTASWGFRPLERNELKRSVLLAIAQRFLPKLEDMLKKI